MSRFIDFIREMPQICGASNADRWGRINVLQFHDEMKGDSVFSASKEDFINPMNRIETAFGWDARHQDRKEYCKKLVLLNMLAHYVKKHNKTEYESEVLSLAEELGMAEAEQPEVATMYSVAEAKLGGWEP